MMGATLMSALALLVSSPMILAKEKAQPEQTFNCKPTDTSTDSLVYVEGTPVRFVPMHEQSPVVWTAKPILVSSCHGGLASGKGNHRKSL